MVVLPARRGIPLHPDGGQRGDEQAVQFRIALWFAERLPGRGRELLFWLMAESRYVGKRRRQKSA